MRRRRRIIQAIAILVALVPFAFIVTQTAATATTIYVPDNYPTIQGAVNAASPGDTIIVRDGTYTENVVVDKANLTIGSENGAEATLVQALDPGSAAFKITADMCLIEGFEVTALNRAIWVASDHNTITGNSFAESGYCIYLSDSSYNTVVYNDFKSHHCGISIRDSTYNTIEHNDFLGDVESHNWGCDGIELAESSDNIVRSCTFRDGGIIVWQSYRNEIYDCQVNGKPLIYLEGESGGVIAGNAGQVILVNCRDMEVRDCEFWKASVGIQLIECSDCKIWNNTCRYCSSHSGISLARSYNNLIEGNSGYHNYDNISLWRSSNNTIRGNECNGYGRGILVGISSNDNVITSNTCTNHYDGISVDSSENNKIYLNDFFNNDHNVDIWDALPNIWNSPQTVLYTYNGNIYTSCLGNYWDDYTGSDADGDGIGDTPYIINSDSDDYPLMEPFENYAETGNQSPIADAGPDQTVTDTDGDGQEQVTLDGSGSYDPDGTIVCWAWTENGNTIMMLETPTVVTLVTGEHTITLEVTDDLGARDTDVVVIAVIAPSVHTVSTPNTPSGPSSGQVGESLTFSTGGSTCSQGHSVQYRFDWGNGNYSSWSSSTSASYTYSATGTYQVRAQARCASNTSIGSNWSAAKTVTIGAVPPAHTVNTPNTPSGPSSGQVGEALPFSTGGSTCSQGHSVQYRFDWGNGNYSDWSFSTSASYAYSTTGTHQVRAQARCASVTSVTSGWSATRMVNIGTAPLPENQRPDPPANLAQLDLSGSEIPVGDAVDIDSVIFRAAVTDPDGDRVILQVELRRLDELSGNFDESQGGFKESNLVTSGTTTTCAANGLIDNSYHWRARAVDEHGRASDWVQFGNNNISEADFTIASALVNPPVLLVHGFQMWPGYHPTEIWQNMAEVLSGRSILEKEDVSAFPGHTFWRLRAVDEEHITIYISNYSVELSATWDNILFYADQLQAELARIRQEEGVEEVDIVAHSMGGLVSRAYVENVDFDPYFGTDGYPDFDTSYANDVRKLIMLGTPNHGSELADIGSFFQIDDILGYVLGHDIVSVGQMAAGRQFLDVLNYGCHGCSGSDQLNPDVEYTVFAGKPPCDYCVAPPFSAPSPGLALMQVETQFSCLEKCREEGEDWHGFDGLVSMESARLDNADLHACIFADHTALRVQQEICEAVRAKLLSQPVPNVIWISDVIQIACPVHVTVTDQYGRIINDSGTDEIPGASVTKDEESGLITLYLNPNLAYGVYIEAYENGKFTLMEILQTQNEDFMINLFEDVPVVAGTKAELTVIPSETERLLEIDFDGDGTIDEEKSPIVIGEEEDAVPDEGSAVVVGPNPVPSGGCVFWFNLPEEVGQVRLMLFSISGRLVFETSIDLGATRFPSAGTWNPVDQEGISLANGPYIYVLIADGKVIGQGKMVIQR